MNTLSRQFHRGDKVIVTTQAISYDIAGKGSTGIVLGHFGNQVNVRFNHCSTGSYDDRYTDFYRHVDHITLLSPLAELLYF